MRIKLFVILIIILSTILINPLPSHACDCAVEQSVNDEYDQSFAVFKGEVLKIKEDNSTKDVVIEVEEIWKGIDESQIIIRTGLGGGDCGVNFQEGHDYLVYARNTKLYGSEYLQTNSCDRTDRLSGAEEDIAILGIGEPPGKQVDLINENNKMISPSMLIWIGLIAGGILTMIIFFFWKGLRKLPN
ncbi:hypothetical protein [Ornithinibacillus halophilus]|uniref:Tissue inhibitor of metalloproteinase n=1 Tax=Ornithinibacillus halophilus TaxID=930117 RepID=A0A1M5NSX8_9BACI|nr:hypothetical protein [Ornithinibacillus halophilus]SHG92724.1 hypothetical protein SAMN05216225_10891 [Ornithinibacillus halophilus]